MEEICLAIAVIAITMGGEDDIKGLFKVVNIYNKGDFESLQIGGPASGTTGNRST